MNVGGIAGQGIGGGGASSAPSNATVIRSESDWPSQDESIIFLLSGAYVIEGSVASAKQYKIQDGAQIFLHGLDVFNSQLIKTGGGDMFIDNPATAGGWLLQLESLGMILADGGRFFNFPDGGSLRNTLWLTKTFLVGSLTQNSVIGVCHNFDFHTESEFPIFVQWDAGFDLKTVGQQMVLDGQWTDGKDSGGAILTLDGVIATSSTLGIYETGPTETVFNIKNATSFTSPFIGPGRSWNKDAGGVFFDPTGKNQKDPSVIFSIPGAPISQLIGSMYLRNNATGTDIVSQGLTLNFQSAEVAGPNTQLNMTDTTGLSNGTVIWLPNTQYKGKYTVSNLVLNTSIEIAVTFDTTDAGEIHTGWTKVAGVTIANDDNERASMPANNKILFSNLDDATLRFQCNYSVNSLIASSDIETCIIKNETDILSGSISPRNAGTSAGEGFCSDVESVTDGDFVELYVRNMSSATRDLLFNSFSLSGK